MIPDAFLTWTAIGISLLALGVGVVTLVTAAWVYYTRRRNDTVRDDLRSDLFEHLFSGDPDWAAWVDTLSRTERRQLLILLEEYLRKLRGTEHGRLCDLAAELGVQDRARRNIERGRKRFRALTWLALLNEEVDPDRLESCCSGSSQLRAGAARVLHEAGHPDAPRIGTELIVDGESLTAFGLDTLYRLNDGSETPLLSAMNRGVDEWTPRLLVQVLIALRHCTIANPRDELGWLPRLLEHESPRVRAAAIGVLERHGWREEIHAEIDIGALLADPDAAVRHDTYLLLASWNTDRSGEWLHRALTTAAGADRLALVRAFRSHSRTELPEPSPELEPFVDWVRADEAVGRRRRVWGVSAAWA